LKKLQSFTSLFLYSQMKELVLLTGGIYGTLAIVIGAFGAHGLKKRFNEDQLKNFDTGVKYQIYHSMMLIISGVVFPFLSLLQQIMAWSFIVGIFLFSFSIYGLTLSSSRGRKIRFLGPVTHLGGLLLVFGWVLFTYNIVKISLYL